MLFPLLKKKYQLYTDLASYHSIISEPVDGDLIGTWWEEGTVHHVAVGLAPPIVNVEILHREGVHRLFGRLQKGGGEGVWFKSGEGTVRPCA